MVEMVDSIKAYILDFCAYDDEPLHILLSALMDEKLCKKANDAIPILLNLLQEGLIKCSYHSGWSGDKYRPVENLKEADLVEQIRILEKYNFTKYPKSAEGGEYFFKTTDIGLKLIEDSS
jgi:hypothetical protein